MKSKGKDVNDRRKESLAIGGNKGLGDTLSDQATLNQYNAMRMRGPRPSVGNVYYQNPNTQVHFQNSAN